MIVPMSKTKQMILSIYCSELTVDGSTPVEADENGFVFASGMEAVNSNGDVLFSVSGSDEYSATIHFVQSYKIISNTFTDGTKDSYVVAVIGEDSKL
jgi:phosphoheptose isomerase